MSRGSMNLLAGELVRGAYRLIRRIGEGSMGTLWVAQQLALDRECVIKFLRPELALEHGIRGRFVREGKALGRLRTPHVVQVYDSSVWTRNGVEVPYIAMELLEGEDLRSRLDRRKVLDAAQTL